MNVLEQARAIGSASSLRKSVKAAWPICAGYFPIGVAFGVLAEKAGLEPLEIGLMSLLVFAGSAQFIAVSMLGSGASLLPIVLTTFIVNLRHLLMSSSLAVYLRGSSRKFLSLYAYGVTDESFAVNAMQFRESGWSCGQALLVNHLANFAWIGSTVLGGYVGDFIPPGYLGIDYALSAMFLCLLVFQLRGRIYVVTALLSGTLAVLGSLLLPGNTSVIAASLIAATTGFFLRRKYLTKEVSHAV